MLENELGEILDAPPDLRAATIALLRQMVTSAAPQRTRASASVRTTSRVGVAGSWRLPITMPGSGHGEKGVVIGLHWTRGAARE